MALSSHIQNSGALLKIWEGAESTLQCSETKSLQVRDLEGMGIASQINYAHKDSSTIRSSVY